MDKHMGLSLSIFKEYCHNVKEIGSIVPDSKTCVKSLLKRVPFASARVIVEFGSASGAVTREIINRKRPDTLFVSFEKNPHLYAALKDNIDGKNVFFINDDVFNCTKVLQSILGARGKIVDSIVSTLPCSCMDFNVLMQHSVLPVLKDKGQFVQYMHTLSMLKGFDLNHSLVKYFKNVVSDFVLFNIPPALVYTSNIIS
jgi:phosphatidylethanolamine/phosphatidyl-N-methylethanolamine N-methyltransferase